ncbi:nitrous oxide reductase accessory protein NosL [Aquabacterium sp. OR-4]|uniref:nitrous oxide reductase accessory protein NosL n=1 Tax=Aquabacterium sp. OR-4 TaxID=2978127 RepID=UPI0021B472D8|nr:nitrous oxide reductase accessory protein NosL [Aquabacterium sp. OR-4]MDT7833678.1 nitrous oxide reductase accessory protein NosL [Aquabacterium sp. OR-4]
MPWLARRRLLLGAGLGTAGLLGWGLPGRWPAAPLAGLASRLGLHPPPATPPDEVCIVAPPEPFDPRSGLAPLAARPVPADARCPVCGMFAARHPRWAAMAIFDDGAAQFFDTPAHLLLYLQNPARYQPGRSAQAVRAMHVANHQGGGWLALAQAVLVHGSRVHGPMRTEDLPAFADADAAAAFIARHGGTAARADALRQALPQGLRALAPHRH